MTDPTPPQARIAIIGAGIIGCAIACALTRAGHAVLLVDRAPPATAGASFGNVGHIATEQLEPLPSPALLAGFWRHLFLHGGPLDLPLRRLPILLPWMTGFALAAFRQRANTAHLGPLVAGAADSMARQLEAVGRGDLLRRAGHYSVWLGQNARQRAERARRHSDRLQLTTQPIPAGALDELARRGASANSAAGVWFPDSAHVLDPAQVGRALARGAQDGGAITKQAHVREIRPRGGGFAIITEGESLQAATVIVCAGPWSAPFLRSFGVRAPLEAERGYHVELPGHAPYADVPVVYADHSVVVTPMTSRLRASSFLEFAGLEAPPDPRKPARLRATLRALGYRCEPEGPSWMGARPTLPDYLPGIGRVPGPHAMFYAVGHQHLGLTLSGVTAELMVDLIAGRRPRFDLSAFDLRRFN